MSEKINICIPDLGGVDSVDVIEIHVKVGDQVEFDQPLIALEGDKASMDVPSTVAGVVKSIEISVGDKVSEDDHVLTIATKSVSQSNDKNTQKAAAKPTLCQVIVPDLGGVDSVDVIEVHVKAGDRVELDQPLIALEGDKASMDVPSTVAGVVKSIDVSVGDKVSEAAVIAHVVDEGHVESSPSADKPAAKKVAQPKAVKQSKPVASQSSTAFADFSSVYAGPSVRRLARELGVDLNKIKGSGEKGRVVRFDVTSYVKGVMQGGGSSGLTVAPMPKIDFTKFGEVDVQPLNKIKRITATNMHRSWVTVPMVTQFAEADITKMDAFRQQHKKQAIDLGFKLTPLVFIMRAVEMALKEFPHFNASLDPSGEKLIVKKYINVGVAADTPKGLVVPVIRDVEDKGLFELAKELGDVSKQAREKGLTPAQMSGGCFTISSLGGIGGTAFTPIVNAPEVAILGVSKAFMKPVFDGKQFIPQMTLPLSLTYDHRVIDGAQAARFVTYLADYLAKTEHYKL